MNKSKAAFFAAVVAFFIFCATTASASAWKIEPLNDQVTVIQQASELQEKDRQEFVCLSLAIYHESKGQPMSGQRAVGHVVLNRKKNGRFGKSICSVVFAPHQFTWSHRSVPSIIPRETRNWKIAQEVALSILNGEPDLTNGALYFYNTKTDRPSWRNKGVQTFRVGLHAFRKF